MCVCLSMCGGSDDVIMRDEYSYILCCDFIASAFILFYMRMRIAKRERGEIQIRSCGREFVTVGKNDGLLDSSIMRSQMFESARARHVRVCRET